jgi:hypothetical protein
MSHPQYKLRGYLYQIVEIFPVEDGNAYRELHTYDRLEDAEKVMAVLESVNYDFTCYAMLMYPVWDNDQERVVARKKRREEWQKDWDAQGSQVFTPCDHHGSTSSLSTDGTFRFHCLKCGLKYGNGKAEVIEDYAAFLRESVKE